MTPEEARRVYRFHASEFVPDATGAQEWAGEAADNAITAASRLDSTDASLASVVGVLDRSAAAVASAATASAAAVASAASLVTASAAQGAAVASAAAATASKNLANRALGFKPGAVATTTQTMTNSVSTEQNTTMKRNEAALTASEGLEIEFACVPVGVADGGTIQPQIKIGTLHVGGPAALTVDAGAANKVIVCKCVVMAETADPTIVDASMTTRQRASATGLAASVSTTPATIGAGAFDIQPTITWSAAGGGNTAKILYLSTRRFTA